MTVSDAFAGALERLRGVSPSARLDAGRLLEHVLGRDGAWLFAHDDAVLSESAACAFEAALERRAHGEPVAYVIGCAGFYGRSFAVSPAVLVPRPESELLIELALERLRSRTGDPAVPRILDVGTGSGALAITLASEMPAAAVTAVDVSPAALAVAEANACNLGCAGRIAFHVSDLTAGLPADERFDAVVANLPYVPTTELAQPPDPTSFEPRLALDGGVDGLDLYRRLLAEVPERLAADGFLVMEAAPGTAGELASLARAALGAEARVTVVPDLGGLERAIVADRRGSRALAAKTALP